MAPHKRDEEEESSEEKVELSEYELLCLKKRARNKARLEALGLDKFKKAVRTAVRKTPAQCRPKRKAQPTKPTRKSRRQSKHPAIIYKPVLGDDEDTRRARAKFKAAKKKTRSANTSKFKCEVPANLSAALTAKQKKVIEKKMEGAWLEKFEVSWWRALLFLTYVPSSTNHILSSPLQITFHKHRTTSPPLTSCPSRTAATSSARRRNLPTGRASTTTRRNTVGRRGPRWDRRTTFPSLWIWDRSARTIGARIVAMAGCSATHSRKCSSFSSTCCRNSLP